jgi:multifunctional beta-oxidation protein
MQPDYIAPLVGFLSSGENQDQTGGVFESLAGWSGQYRWQRAGGYGFSSKKVPTPEEYAAKFGVYTTFGACSPTPSSPDKLLKSRSPDDGRATHPSSTQESAQQVSSSMYRLGGVDRLYQYADDRQLRQRSGRTCQGQALIYVLELYLQIAM